MPSWRPQRRTRSDFSRDKAPFSTPVCCSSLPLAPTKERSSLPDSGHENRYCFDSRSRYFADREKRQSSRTLRPFAARCFELAILEWPSKKDRWLLSGKVGSSLAS